jgi:hypothetical protein
MRVALWIAAALFLVLLLLYALWALTRGNARRALERLRKAHAHLTPEQKATLIAQQVAWYLSLPEDQQTAELWERIQAGEGP